MVQMDLISMNGFALGAWIENRALNINSRE